MQGDLDMCLDRKKCAQGGLASMRGHARPTFPSSLRLYTRHLSMSSRWTLDLDTEHDPHHGAHS